MSYNWNFEKDFIGTIQMPRNIKEEKEYYPYNLYSGNGLFIALYETKKCYNVITFAIDEKHFINCIKDNMYNDCTFTLKNTVNSRKIAKTMIMNCKDEFTINFTKNPAKAYYEGDEDNDND